MIPTRFFRASDHGGYQPLLKDPAIERWNNMREDLYKGFRLRRQNIVPILSLVVAFPVAVYAMVAWETEQGFDFSATTYDTPLRQINRRPEDLEEIRSLKEYKQYKDL